jgi:putative toxin-antitoxin system antitoxin component (TIGR02293 family)
MASNVNIAETRENDPIAIAVQLLGGEAMFDKPVSSGLEAHRVISRGLPGKALAHLVANIGLMESAGALEKAVGISLRTFQRRKKDGGKVRLSKEQSGRAFKFAEIVGLATQVLGSQNAAEEWLSSPALGLDEERPLDLLDTPAGVELVETYLGRMAHGVYT